VALNSCCTPATALHAGNYAVGVMTGRNDTVAAPRKWRDWAEYVRAHLDALEWSPSKFAQVSGLDRSMITRWLKRETEPAIDSIRAAARAFDRDIREGLVAAGFFTEEEMGFFRDEKIAGEPDLRLVDDDDLLDELKRRMKQRLDRSAPMQHARGATADEARATEAGDGAEIGGKSGVDVESAKTSPAEGSDLARRSSKSLTPSFRDTRHRSRHRASE
jgi:transcriptional regulator with XRE-family HTH domain